MPERVTARHPARVRPTRRRDPKMGVHDFRRRDPKMGVHDLSHDLCDLSITGVHPARARASSRRRVRRAEDSPRAGRQWLRAGIGTAVLAVLVGVCALALEPVVGEMLAGLGAVGDGAGWMAR